MRVLVMLCVCVLLLGCAILPDILPRPPKPEPAPSPAPAPVPTPPVSTLTSTEGWQLGAVAIYTPPELVVEGLFSPIAECEMRTSGNVVVAKAESAPWKGERMLTSQSVSGGWFSAAPARWTALQMPSPAYFVLISADGRQLVFEVAFPRQAGEAVRK